MRRPFPRLIAVTVVSLVIAGIWMFLPGQQSTAEAFNRFAAAVVSAKTARYQVEISIEGQPKQKAKAYYFAPARFRQEVLGMVNVGDLRAGKMVMLNAKQKTAMQMVFRGKTENAAVNDNFERLRELLTQIRDGKENDYVRIGEKEFDGKRAVGFRFDSPAATITLWGDPATTTPVRIETIWSGVPRTEVTMFNFEINVSLDEALFDLTPPADYKLQSFDVDASKPTEADLVAALTTSVEIGQGEFPESADTAGIQKIILKYAEREIGKNDKEGKKSVSDEKMQQLMKHSVAIGRGFQFAMDLPESAEAHYAGKGVKRDAKDRPIFWYRREGKETHRVIFADLSVKDADAAPKVEGAQRIEKASKQTKPTAER